MNIKKRSITLFLLGITFGISQAQNILPTEGDVGIGTITPTQKLDVNGDVRVRALEHASTAGNGNGNNPGIGLRYVMVDATGKLVLGDVKAAVGGIGGGSNAPQPGSCNSGGNALPPNAWKELSDNFSTWAQLCSHENLRVSENFRARSGRIIDFTSANINTGRIFTSTVGGEVEIDSKLRAKYDAIINNNLRVNNNTIIDGNLTINGYCNKLSVGSRKITSGDHTDYMLSVDGKILTTEIVVTEDDWADYVFEDNYKLRSLNDLQIYIDTEGHLPEIPTTKDVEENGVNLGEINVLLLKKVEELTLYTLQQQKALETQQKQIEELKAIIKK